MSNAASSSLNNRTFSHRQGTTPASHTKAKATSPAFHIDLLQVSLRTPQQHLYMSSKVNGRSNRNIPHQTTSDFTARSSPMHQVTTQRANTKYKSQISHRKAQWRVVKYGKMSQTVSVHQISTVQELQRVNWRMSSAHSGNRNRPKGGPSSSITSSISMRIQNTRNWLSSSRSSLLRRIRTLSSKDPRRHGSDVRPHLDEALSVSLRCMLVV